jgi:hypothetical protein
MNGQETIGEKGNIGVIRGALTAGNPIGSGEFGQEQIRDSENFRCRKEAIL